MSGATRTVALSAALIHWSGNAATAKRERKSRGKLEAIIEDLLDDPDWLKNVPEISTKEYSGRITLRVSPEEHKLLAARSASRGLTINRYLKEKALGA